LGNKNNDGGQFFTPREIIRVIVSVLNPEPNKTIHDPCCGTGGFFIEAYNYIMQKKLKPKDIEYLKNSTFWGREEDDNAILILLCNLIIHEIESPKIWHGNTLTLRADSAELFINPPQQFDYILTNPPFGSKEGKAAQSRFPYKCGKAQILFLQDFIDSLKDGGKCGIVIDEGTLFHSKTKAYLQTKKKLLNECNLYCIVSLPPGVFVNAKAASKTNLLFFQKGNPTKKIWYYDMSITEKFVSRKVNKGNPLNYEHFNDFFYRFNLKEDNKKRISERSWYLNINEIKTKKYQIHAVNKNKPDLSDKRKSEEVLLNMRQISREIVEDLNKL
jgi:type I restriction enzyme M protein